MFTNQPRTVCYLLSCYRSELQWNRRPPSRPLVCTVFISTNQWPKYITSFKQHDRNLQKKWLFLDLHDERQFARPQPASSWSKASLKKLDARLPRIVFRNDVYGRPTEAWVRGLICFVFPFFWSYNLSVKSELTLDSTLSSVHETMRRERFLESSEIVLSFFE